MSAPALASPAEVHHAVPRCLLRLHDEARDPSCDLDGAGIQARLEWEWEALRWSVSAEIAPEDLERLVKASTVLLEREEHRLIHGSDWQRWGDASVSPRSGDTGRVGTASLPSSGGDGWTVMTWTAPAWSVAASRARKASRRPYPNEAGA